MPTTILVTGAGGSAAYNFIHSLQLVKNRYRTIGVDINKNHLTLSNADYKYLVPPFSKPAEYIAALNRIIKKHSVSLVHPQPDPEVAFIAQNRQRLKAPTFLPSTKTVTLCQNKIAAIDVFKKAQVPHAQSFVLTSKKDVSRAFKTIQKSSSQKLWIRAIKGAGSKAALPVTTVAEADFWVSYWQNNKGIGYGDFMISEFLPGKEYAFQSVWHEGRLVVSQARERQEYIFGNLTPSGQSSSPSVAVSVHNDSVNQIATQAVKAVSRKPHGIFCVDLKENSQGIPCVIEINPGRFFTTSNFFSVAGCNMPDIYVSVALGKRIPKVKPYNNLKPGLYWLRVIDMGFKLVDKTWGLNGDYSK